MQEILENKNSPKSLILSEKPLANSPKSLMLSEKPLAGWALSGIRPMLGFTSWGPLYFCKSPQPRGLNPKTLNPKTLHHSFHSTYTTQLDARMQTWIRTFNRMQRIRDMREKKKQRKKTKQKRKKRFEWEPLSSIPGEILLPNLPTFSLTGKRVYAPSDSATNDLIMGKSTARIGGMPIQYGWLSPAVFICNQSPGNKQAPHCNKFKNQIIRKQNLSATSTAFL